MRESANPMQYVKAAFALIATLLVFLVFFLLISLFRPNPQDNDTVAGQAGNRPFLACNFTNTGADEVPLYLAPYAHPLYAFYTVPAGIPYSVVSFNIPSDFIEIEVNGIVGYVDPFSGTAVGECDPSYVRYDETAITDLSVVCVFTLSTQAPVYRDASLTQAVTTRQADERFILLERSEAGFYIANTNGFSGWVHQTSGVQTGACGAIPNHETGLN